MPNNFDVDFSNLIAVHLASFPIPPQDPHANLPFANPDPANLEIRQENNGAANAVDLPA